MNSPAPPEHLRSVRSFVLREGRITAAQERALEKMLPQIGVPFVAGAAPDWDTLFGRQAPRIVEIGTGMGEATAQMAAAAPEHDFIAIEVHRPGVGNLCQLIKKNELSNLRIVVHDAVPVLQEMIAPASLAGIRLFFPDPWPKKRHHKRRIIQPAFATLAASRLAPDGLLHCATDWQSYAEWILAVLEQETLLKNTCADYAPRPQWRAETKFEKRGLRLGHSVWDLIFKRLPPAPDKETPL